MCSQEAAKAGLSGSYSVHSVDHSITTEYLPYIVRNTQGEQINLGGVSISDFPFADGTPPQEGHSVWAWSDSHCQNWTVAGDIHKTRFLNENPTAICSEGASLDPEDLRYCYPSGIIYQPSYGNRGVVRDCATARRIVCVSDAPEIE
jgi:hypothetical protein